MYLLLRKAGALTAVPDNRLLQQMSQERRLVADVYAACRTKPDDVRLMEIAVIAAQRRSASPRSAVWSTSRPIGNRPVGWPPCEGPAGGLATRRRMPSCPT